MLHSCPYDIMFYLMKIAIVIVVYEKNVKYIFIFIFQSSNYSACRLIIAPVVLLR